MRVLRFTLRLLTIVGCWQPYLRTSSVNYTLYNMYTLFILSAMGSVTFTQFMDIVVNIDNAEDFTNILYTMSSLCVASCKIFNLWMHHDSVAVLVQNLTEGFFQPLVSDEEKIRQKFDRMTHMYAKSYTVLVEVACGGFVLVSLLTDFRNRKLSFSDWVPYDYSSYVVFCLTYTYQYFSGVSCAFVNVACDNLIIGLLLHLCCQITILQYRLRNIRNDQESLRTCICHHHQIIAYAYAVNKRFTRLIALQFITSTFVMCSSLYQLTRTSLSVNHISLISYTYCMLVQIFIYCWFGNKLKWMLLKTSYSAYNLLIQI